MSRDRTQPLGSLSAPAQARLARSGSGAVFQDVGAFRRGRLIDDQRREKGDELALGGDDQPRLQACRLNALRPRLIPGRDPEREALTLDRSEAERAERFTNKALIAPTWVRSVSLWSRHQARLAN